MTMIKSYNLSVLSESQKNELANSLSQVLVEGITEEDSDGTVINAFRLLKIKIKVILKDQYGNSLTKTVDF